MIKPLQQTTFESIVTKGKVCYSLNVFLFIESFTILDLMFYKSSAADLLYVGNS